MFPRRGVFFLFASSVVVVTPTARGSCCAARLSGRRSPPHDDGDRFERPTAHARSRPARAADAAAAARAGPPGHPNSGRRRYVHISCAARTTRLLLFPLLSGQLLTHVTRHILSARRYILSAPDQCDAVYMLPHGHPSGRHSKV